MALSQTTRPTPKQWYQRLPIVVGVLLVGAVIFTVVIRVLTPPPTPVETQVISSTPNPVETDFIDVRYTGETVAIPEQLAVATTTTSLSQQQVVQALASRFTLSQSSDSQYFWTGGRYSMSLDPSRNEYMVIGGHDDDEFYNSYIDTDAAVKIATELISDLFPDSSLQVDEANIKYFGDGHEPAFVSEDKAVKALIPFTYFVAEYPVFLLHDELSPVTLTVDSNGDIQRLSVRVPLLSPQPARGEALATLSIPEAIESIITDQATVIAARTDRGQRYTLNQLRDVNLQRATVEYRFDPNSSLLYPFYRFTGTAVSGTSSRIDVTVVTPAVSSSN